jgi:uncharacterized protein YcsI (UPF0317 family)
MPDQQQLPRQSRVTSSYTATYPDPIVMRAGDPLTVGAFDVDWPAFVWCIAADGRSGWVPDRMIARGEGDQGTALADYSAAELTIAADEIVTIEAEEGGWMWVTDREGRSGWVPEGHLGPVE